MGNKSVLPKSEIKKMLLSWLRTDDGASMVYQELMHIVKGTTEELKAILFKHIVRVIPSFTIDAIIIGEPNFNKSMTSLSVSIFFDDAQLKRSSLYVSDRWVGVNNIVLLMSRGYHAKNQVYGNWHGHITFSLQTRLPNSFLQEAINEFNMTNTFDVVAQLNGIYKK